METGNLCFLSARNRKGGTVYPKIYISLFMYLTKSYPFRRHSNSSPWTGICKGQYDLQPSAWLCLWEVTGPKYAQDTPYDSYGNSGTRGTQWDQQQQLQQWGSHLSSHCNKLQAWTLDRSQDLQSCKRWASLVLLQHFKSRDTLLKIISRPSCTALSQQLINL